MINSINDVATTLSANTANIPFTSDVVQIGRASCRERV